jgi:hypothetical protein
MPKTLLAANRDMEANGVNMVAGQEEEEKIEDLFNYLIHSLRHATLTNYSHACQEIELLFDIQVNHPVVKTLFPTLHIVIYLCTSETIRVHPYH